jgi:hypothetical protein
MKLIKCLLLICLITVSLNAFGQLQQLQSEDVKNPHIEKARQFFEIVVTMYNTYDQQLADLYADNAILTLVRLYPNGEKQELALDGIHAKNSVRATLRRAQALRETISFGNVFYNDEGDMVRITASLHNELTNRIEPYELLIGESSDGAWRIFSEKIQSQP